MPAASLSTTALVPTRVLNATVTRSGQSCALDVGPLSISAPLPDTIARSPGVLLQASRIRVMRVAWTPAGTDIALVRPKTKPWTVTARTAANSKPPRVNTVPPTRSAASVMPAW
ncbi:hypothetical protein SAMN05216188_118181 [Lentzea xinjiangensis]|uniref:Uncharacterized protein n=1 Tax=Lentzea xinjiangensis TaxID=402600 RepID=A0A1H9TLG1_9PSEU|nr:hypothetical protein [Lentzea xinjiangensis]SER97749.1 hypothetical protein SAMN05216188_118181 [Lentzea xinjiangensis]